ncbi:MAG: CBS domain-containing protein [Thermodesulfobacteriota bacterium]|nr:CBS domain-containing protein [Thermodesulfobacteriota bacterium]
MIKIKDIMTTDVFILPSTQTLDTVRSLMKSRHIRHVPIVDKNNQFIGLITHRDLLSQTVSILADIDEREQADLDRNIHIMNVMKTDVVTVSPELDLCSAILILLKNKYGCLPVVSDKKLVGIVTAADFLKLTYDLLKNTEEM